MIYQTMKIFIRIPRPVSDAEWKEEFEQNVVPVVSGYYRAMPLFEREKRYDLMMAEAERRKTGWI